MKLDYDLYNILKHLCSTGEAPNMLRYKGNKVIVFRGDQSSGFTEVSVPNFFDVPVVVNNLSKFLKLFIFPAKEKGEIGPRLSAQDWIVIDDYDEKSKKSIREIYLKMKGHNVKLRQGSKMFIEDTKNYLVSKFNNIEILNPIVFQLSGNLYRQIINDCSLLELDTINFKSLNEHTIKIILTKKDKDLTEDFSSYDIECEHEHFSNVIAISLNSFNLIDAPDHQIEFGKFKEHPECLLVKVRSFYSSDYEVDKLIIGSESKVK